MKRLPAAIFAILAMLAGFSAERARAEPTGLLAVWDKLATEMRAEKKTGGVIIDAVPARDGRACGSMLITVKPVGGGWNDTIQVPRMADGSWGVPGKHGSFVRLPPGRYEVITVTCGWWGRTGDSFEGPFARFEIRAGEFVDLGVLRLYATGGRIHSVSVTAMAPEARAMLKERMPKNFGFLRVRHMTPIPIGSLQKKS